jgi:thiazole/oxazole-forming peptide maturase SagD family component
LLWVEGQDLVSGESLWLPFELVSLNYTVPQAPGSGRFPATSNGLASGNHWLEAISHGLFEVVERDALTLWRLGGDEARRGSGLDLATVDDPLAREMLQRFERAEIEVRVWNATSDVGIACFICLIAGRKDQSADPEVGAGCHPAREVALLRALAEAAQARMTYITGVRDDFAAHLYREEVRQARLREARAWIRERVAGRRFDAVPSFASDAIEADIDHALRRLARVGVGQVVTVDLTKPELGLPVVRVVIPGLEGPYQGAQSDYVPGPRARAVLEGGR